jgi:hypothetical protein
MFLKRNLHFLSYLRAYKALPTPAPVPACFRQGSGYLRAYKAQFYALFCTFYASLRLKRTVFTRPKTCLPHEIAQRYLFGVPSVANHHSSIILNHLYGLYSFAFSLKSYGISSTKEQVRKNKLFMQNEPNFRKVKFNVTKVLTTDYDQLDTWSIRKTKPIKAN